jgi:hypothetical protein
LLQAEIGFDLRSMWNRRASSPDRHRPGDHVGLVDRRDD